MLFQAQVASKASPKRLPFMTLTNAVFCIDLNSGSSNYIGIFPYKVFYKISLLAFPLF